MSLSTMGGEQAPQVSIRQYFPSQTCGMLSHSRTVNVVVCLDAFGCYIVIGIVGYVNKLEGVFHTS
jgi:hypothetical protein